MASKRKMVFVDAFAGCGGLSLGLLQAGMEGLFAIEQDAFAFSTLKHNLLSNDSEHKFAWPSWLPEEPIAIEKLIEDHREDLLSLRGKVDILAGGPPCQGFSTAGRRRANDPRNRLFKSYVELVQIIKPKIVLMENVRGFTINFKDKESVDNYSKKLRDLLSKDYKIHERLLDLSQFGVPQRRVRYFLIALHPSFGNTTPFKVIEEMLPTFLRELSIQTPVSSWAAISDLEVERGGTQESIDSKGFLETRPSTPRTNYQRLMAAGSKANDLRLARHSPDIAKRFADIIEACQAEGRLNTSIGTELRQKYQLKKQALRVLDPDGPAPTVTSMPDDLLHYREPRTLTVRENARLQSFPDWFAFKGKYTTGGHRRRHEVPRFTQVANAVPPLAAQMIGRAIASILADHKPHSRLSSLIMPESASPHEVRETSGVAQAVSAEVRATVPA